MRLGSSSCREVDGKNATRLYKRFGYMSTHSGRALLAPLPGETLDRVLVTDSCFYNPVHQVALGSTRCAR